MKQWSVVVKSETSGLLFAASSAMSVGGLI